MNKTLGGWMTAWFTDKKYSGPDLVKAASAPVLVRRPKRTVRN